MLLIERATSGRWVMALRKFIIERDIPKVGTFEREQLRGAAAKSNGVLRQLGPDIQWSPTTRRSASISPKMRISFASTRRLAAFRQARSLRSVR
jgi:hypothetical protein